MYCGKFFPNTVEGLRTRSSSDVKAGVMLQLGRVTNLQTPFLADNPGPRAGSVMP
jgi:hypothetical protein